MKKKKKTERKLLPSTEEQKEGLDAHKSLPRERKRRAELGIVLLVVACLKERECVDFQPVREAERKCLKV